MHFCQSNTSQRSECLRYFTNISEHNNLNFRFWIRTDQFDASKIDDRRLDWDWQATGESPVNQCKVYSLVTFEGNVREKIRQFIPFLLFTHKTRKSSCVNARGIPYSPQQGPMGGYLRWGTPPIGVPPWSSPRGGTRGRVTPNKGTPGQVWQGGTRGRGYTPSRGAPPQLDLAGVPPLHNIT